MNVVELNREAQAGENQRFLKNLMQYKIENVNLNFKLFSNKIISFNQFLL